MIKIIKPGEIKRQTCPECGCYFSYEPEDVMRPEYKGDGKGILKYVVCPQCSYKIILSATRKM